MPKACNPEHVYGQMMALGDAHGSTVLPEVVDDMSTGEKSAFFEIGRQDGAEIFDVSANQPEANMLSLEWWKDLIEDKTTIKDFHTSFANPSSVLGEDIVSEFDNLLVDLQDATPFEYKQEIREFFDSVDTTGLNDAQMRYFERYKQAYQNPIGSEAKGWIEDRLDSVTKGVIHLNPTIIVGNPVETLLKMPALYGTDGLKGIMMAHREGGGDALALFRKHPKLIEQGVYGLEHAGDASKGMMDKVMQGFDVPFRNMWYYTGLANGGTEAAGRLAVQRGLFVPRAGDIPLAYHGSLGRQQLRLLGYTLNTYKMLGGLAEGALRRDPKALAGLAYYATMAWALGGMAGAIPQPLTELIGLVSQDAEDYIKEDKRALTGLIQAQGINRIGITTDIFNKNLGIVGKAFSDKETANPESLVFALSGLLFKSDLLNNKFVQRGVNQMLDVWRGEEELGTAAQETFLPFTVER